MALAGPSVTVSVRFPMVIVAVRAVVRVFCAAVKATVPFPVPEAPDVTVNQAALLLAVHEQPGAVVTAMVPYAPLGVCVVPRMVIP